MINFRYNIVRKVGEGGSGEVFLVDDTLHRRQVALKVLHGHMHPDAPDSVQFDNEVATLLNLEHPGLVRMFDFGVVRQAPVPALVGRRFLTMEFVEGRDLLTWFRDSAEVHVHVLKGILLQAVHLLEYIHRRGVIHFDIKPENLLLVDAESESDVPAMKLTDFGFSKRAGENLEDAMRGTLEYTAPELLRHEPYDHRIDLYSLGASFYHVVEGRCPFEAGTPVDLIKCILAETRTLPVSGDRDRDDVHAVINRLLEKNPSDRFASAADVARCLHRNGTSRRATPRPFVRPPFVGRKPERQRLFSLIDTLAEGSPTLQPVAVLISGVEGIGKSALTAEAVRHARGQGVLIGDLEGGEIPFGSLRTLMAMLRMEILSRGTDAGQLSPMFDLASAASASRDSSQDWEKERERWIELFARLILECARTVPILLVADARIIDPESLQVLQTALRDAPRGRLLLLATGNSCVEPSLPQNRDERQTERVILADLMQEDVETICLSVFDRQEFAVAVGRRIFELYGGVPAVAVEAVHTVYDSVPLAPDEGSEFEALLDPIMQRLPGSLDQFLMNRYRAVRREDQLLLSVIACCEGPTPVGVLAMLLPFGQRRIFDQLRRLSAEGYLLFDAARQEALIPQERLKAAIASSMSAEKEALHTRIAEALEHYPGGHTFDQLQELAFQHAAAGNFEQAAVAAEAAADEGMKFSAFEKSIHLYDRAIRLMLARESPHRMQTLKVKMLEGLSYAGRYREAIDLSRELLDQPDIAGDRRFSLLKTLGLALSKLGEFAEARNNLADAFTIAPDEVSRLQLRQELVGIDIATGDYAGAEKECLLQQERAASLHDDRLRATISTDLGIALFFQNRFDESAEYFRDALQFYQTTNDRGRIADSLLNIGNAMGAKGDHRSAIESWNRALEISKQYGTLNQQAQILNSLGIAHYDLRQFQKAKTLYLDAQEKLERIDSKPGIAYALTNLGEVCFAEGEFETALENWLRAYDLYAAMDDAQGLTETLLQLALLQSTLGNTSQGRERADQAYSVITERGLNTFLGQYKYAAGVLSLQMGELAAARVELTHAEALLAHEGNEEGRWRSALRRAECMRLQGDEEEAIAEIKNILEEARGHPDITGEANLALGVIARNRGDLVDERSLALLKRGLDAIAKEPVTELSWKLSLELAREFDARGQHDKADYYLRQASTVLDYFLRKFRSPSLRQQFITSNDRGSVISLANERLHFQGDSKA
jgi:serine/threonine protein kinase/tetratricopeptide (TPR) repeat protein